MTEPNDTGRARNEKPARRQSARCAEGSGRKQNAAPYAPTPREAEARRRVAAERDRIPAPKVRLAVGPDNSLAISPDHADDGVWAALVAHAFGSANRELASMALRDCIVMAGAGTAESVSESVANGLIAAVRGIEPRDTIEGMLALQMVAVHRATIDCLRRAGIQGQTIEARTMNLNHAGKLGRTFAAQVEALGRHRGKGQQTVEVRHIHVGDGGRAVFGTVNNVLADGGRGNTKTEVQPHAQALAHAPVASVWSADAAGKAVPLACGDGEEAVQDARRGGG